MKIEFSGGLETVFGGDRELQISMPTKEVTVQEVLNRLAIVAREREGDVSLFLQDGLVRPGILVLINDADWELLDKEDTIVGSNDVLHFNSTLHGGYFRVHDIQASAFSKTMTKATETLLFLGVLSFIWLISYLGFLPLPEKVQKEIVPVLPWWSLVSFGSYALFTLGYDVVTFNDKPEKFKELKQQIAEAKRELKLQGVSVDE